MWWTSPMEYSPPLKKPGLSGPGTPAKGLGIIGAVLGHLFTGYDLTILSVFGIVAMSGVVVNDALVLLDQVNAGVRRGRRRASAPSVPAGRDSSACGDGPAPGGKGWETDDAGAAADLRQDRVAQIRDVAHR